MPYQALARQWRPQQLSEVIGQAVTVQALTNALNEERLHHAYLFTGTRGVGKTSIARILAKCVNCEQGMQAVACGECDNCVAIDAGRFVDLLEIDAASRTKVEDTRELLNNVQYAPAKGRYKVYLIDEVHMLSNHSFNALLKTLEEPPPHVLFILATTDPQRLPPTILSRCLQFHLKNLLPEQITNHLQHILEQEQIHFEQAALQCLAEAARGSMRDALSLLDQAIAYGNNVLTLAPVQQMLGQLSHDNNQKLLNLIAAGDLAPLLAFSKELAEQGTDFQQAIQSLAQSCYQIALLQHCPPALDDPLAKLAQQISPEDIQLLYQICLSSGRDLPYAPSPHCGFDMMLIRMLHFRPVLTEAGHGQAHTAGAGQTYTAGAGQTHTAGAGQAHAAGAGQTHIAGAGQTHAANAQQAHTDGTKPTQTEYAKPAQADGTKPAQTDSGKPTQVDNTKPAQADDTKPAQADDTKPVQADDTKPVQADGTKPVQADDTKPVQADDTKPAQADDTKPVQADDAKPVQADGTKPVQADDAKPVQADCSALDWNALFAAMSLKGVTKTMASYCIFKGFDENQMMMQIEAGQRALATENAVQRLQAAIGKQLGRDIILQIEVADGELPSPARLAQQKREQAQAKAVEIIAKDPNVKKLEQQFDAVVLPESICSVDNDT